MNQNPDQKAKEVIQALTPTQQVDQNPWAKLAGELKELIKQESPEVQQSHHEMDSGKLRYPEYRWAKQQKEGETMVKSFDHDIQEEVLDVCEKHGVPDDLAEKVSFIMASDNATLPNFGRTPEDIIAIQEVLPYLNTLREE